MHTYQNDDMSWAIQRLNDHVSFSGWFFAIICGMCLWALMLRMLI
jgi:hypothetical protein